MNAREKFWMMVALLLLLLGSLVFAYSMYQVHQIVVARENAVEVAAKVVKVEQRMHSGAKVCNLTLSFQYKGSVVVHRTRKAETHLCVGGSPFVKAWYRHRKKGESSIALSSRVPGWIFPVLLVLLSSISSMAGGIWAFVLFLRSQSRKQDLFPELKEEPWEG